MDIVLILLAGLSLVVFLSVIELVRSRRLKEKYAILWLCSSLAMTAFSFSRELLHSAARILGIKYPPALIFLVGLLFLVIINIHFSVVISQLSDKNKTLAHELALLSEEISRRDSGHEQGRSDQRRADGSGEKALPGACRHEERRNLR